MRRTRTLLAIVGLALVALVTGAAPAGAQQIVDAGKQGDGSGALAFVIFAACCMIIVAALFFMDRIRRRSTADETPE